MTIRDTVEIASSRAEGSHFRLTLMTSDTLVAPHSGTLVVRYDSAQALDSEINANADLTVTNNGQSLGLDTVANHLGSSIQSTYFCNQPSTVFGDWFRYYPGQGVQDSLWNVGQVSERDKIAFDYDGKRVGYTYLTGATSDSTWVGGAEGCYDLPVFYYEDAIWVTALVEPDSDGIHLELPADSVWPSFPSDGVYDTFDRSVIQSSLSPIVVTVLDSGQPLSNRSVTVSAEWVQESGGHVHQDTVICTGKHPTKSIPGGKMSFEVLGTSSVSNDSLTTETDTNGHVQLRFNAPAWGGRVVIRARTDIDGTTAEASDTLNVRVPGLQMLQFSGDYVKLGGNGVHPGPDDNWKGFSYTPDYNHWATSETISLLLEINNLWDVSGQSPLWINDMSLINGGQFDECGNWNRPHQFHRVGRDLDIRTQRASDPRTGILVETVRTWMDGQKKRVEAASLRFNRFAQDIIGLNPPPAVHEDGKVSEHYHLYFYPPKK